MSQCDRASLSYGKGIEIATATLLLVRHAEHGHLGKILSGRSEGIPLTQAGRTQADALGRRLAGSGLTAIHASPVQRAQETAAAIAQHGGLTVRTEEALNEIDFGQWTGRSFDAISGEPAWREWNEHRDTAAPPGGESMAAAQARALAHVQHVAQQFDGGTVALVTHCDIIRAVVAGVLGLSLQAVHRFDIDPASVTRVIAGDWGSRLKSMNEGI